MRTKICIAAPHKWTSLERMVGLLSWWFESDRCFSFRLALRVLAMERWLFLWNTCDVCGMMKQSKVELLLYYNIIYYNILYIKQVLCKFCATETCWYLTLKQTVLKALPFSVLDSKEVDKTITFIAIATISRLSIVCSKEPLQFKTLRITLTISSKGSSKAETKYPMPCDMNSMYGFWFHSYPTKTYCIWTKKSFAIYPISWKTNRTSLETNQVSLENLNKYNSPTPKTWPPTEVTMNDQMSIWEKASLVNGYDIEHTAHGIANLVVWWLSMSLC